MQPFFPSVVFVGDTPLYIGDGKRLAQTSEQGLCFFGGVDKISHNWHSFGASTKTGKDSH